MELVHEFDFEAALGESLQVGAGPFGQRVVATVSEGWARGERIAGRLVGAAADWAVIGPDGYADIDVRGQLRTDDGAVLYLRYTGVLQLNPAVAAALAGGRTSFDDQYFRTHVRIEAGDERYAWVNRTLFVGRGRIGDGGVVYEVFRLT